MRKSLLLITAWAVCSACTSKVQFSSLPLDAAKSVVVVCNPASESCHGVAKVSESYQAPPPSGKADIVFIVDSTPTMFLTVEALATRFSGMLDSLNNLDWQVGIANASLNSSDAFRFNLGELLPLTPNPSPADAANPFTVIKPQTASGSDIFSGNMNFHYATYPTLPGDVSFCDLQPFCSNGPSEPLRALNNLIANRTHANNAAFFRPGAYLVPIIISAGDENNGSPKVQPSDVVNTFKQSLASSMAGLRAVSVVIQPGDSACLAQYSTIFKMGDGGKYGTSLDQFAKQTGGKSISICQNNFTSALADLPQSLVTPVSAITLQQAPLPGSLSITTTPAIKLSYTLAGTVVTFASPLPAGIQLNISYSVPTAQ